MLNFNNFMKCISDLSYSGMFTKENSKKFDFKRIIEPETQATTDDDMIGDDIHNTDKRKQRDERQAELRKKEVAIRAANAKEMSVKDVARKEKKEKVISD
jgi:hypothetical protein